MRSRRSDLTQILINVYEASGISSRSLEKEEEKIALSGYEVNLIGGIGINAEGREKRGNNPRRETEREKKRRRKKNI